MDRVPTLPERLPRSAEAAEHRIDALIKRAESVLAEMREPVAPSPLDAPPVPLTILHISTRLILGGSQENTVLSCEAQVRAGHRVHLAFGPIFGPEGSMLERVEAFTSETGHHISTHEVPDLIRSINPRRDKQALAQLRTLIEKLDPDIVHTHSSKAGILGRLAAWQVRQTKKSRPAIVHTIHGPPFMPEEGTTLGRALIRLKNNLYARAERNAARKCDAIVSVADAMTDQFLARDIGTPDLYTTVRSGMEIDAFLEPAPGESRANIRDQLGIEQGEFVIGTVARLAQHKGHDDILDALAPLMKEHLTWRLLWVGDGWWTERLMKRVAELGLSQRVLNTGLVPPERIPGLMRAMDVLVHPSAREGLPRTVPQALLSGVCPIAYDVDGTREVCVDHQTGRLIPFGDKPALAEAVRWLAAHPAERKAMAERGKARILEDFSARTMARNLETVYAQAIERANETGAKKR